MAWKRNANEFRPRGGPSTIDEHIKQEWELDYLARLDWRERRKKAGDPSEAAEIGMRVGESSRSHSYFQASVSIALSS